MSRTARQAGNSEPTMQSAETATRIGAIKVGQTQGPPEITEVK
jgi:hypothetical protein